MTTLCDAGQTRRAEEVGFRWLTEVPCRAQARSFRAGYAQPIDVTPAWWTGWQMRSGQGHPLHPTTVQQALLVVDGPWARACRDVWNAALDERLGALRAARGRKMPKGWWPTYASQCRGLTAAKAECDWLREAPHHVLQQTLRDLDAAWAAWLYDRRAGKPRWRAHKRASRNHWSPSYRFPDRTQFQIRRLSRRTGEIRLPKIGRVRFRWTADLPAGGQVTNVTVSQDRVGDWTIAFAIDHPDIRPAVHVNAGTAVGVDRGVTVAVATSDGELLDMGPTLTLGEAERLRRLERQKARQQKGSNRQAKTRTAIAKLKRRQARRRADFAHKTSHRLATTFETVVIEDLNVAGMTASARGTVDQPGTNVKAKAGLNRAITDKSWGRLTTLLAYKTERNAGTLIKVNPAHTSQSCAACGHTDPKSRENQADFRCTACRHTAHADINAATVLLTRGTAPSSGEPRTVPAAGPAVAARQALQPSGGATKREPAQQPHHAHAA